jgi:hypothetical protein
MQPSHKDISDGPMLLWAFMIQVSTETDAPAEQQQWHSGTAPPQRRYCYGVQQPRGHCPPTCTVEMGFDNPFPADILHAVVLISFIAVCQGGGLDRWPITVALSYDGGETWSHVRDLDREPLALVSDLTRVYLVYVIVCVPVIRNCSY